MNKNQRRILDAVSSLDDEVVDRVSNDRFFRLNALWARTKKRNRRILFSSIGAGALAACILILALLLPTLLLPGDGEDPSDGIPVSPDGKQVPIYQGMSVSNEPPVVKESAQGNGMLLLSAQGDIHGHRPEIDRDKPFGQSKKDVAESIRESLEIDHAKDEHYYAAKNTDIYITVHLSNPDEFEILSFTLNGVKYSSYMFETGSDLENLVLKVNTGENEGIAEYTIDAIKYVDGTDIKDVRMDGERTVKVIITPEAQPKAEMTVGAGLYSIDAAVKVEDTLSLIGKGENVGVFAYLYDGESLIGEKELSVGENTVSFDGLSQNTLYEVAVVALYDALDGEGISMHLLAREAIYTEAYVLFDEVEIYGEKITFSLLWNEAVAKEERVLSSLEIYEDGAKLKNLEGGTTEIAGLKSETEYTLRATCETESETVKLTLTFATEKLYEMTFATNGGAAMPPFSLSVKDELPIPTREGYTFGGWYRDKLLSEAVVAVPAGGGTLYAYWKEESRPSVFGEIEPCEGGLALFGLAAGEVHTSLTVPAYVGDVPVKYVGLTEDTNLKEVVLPDGIETFNLGGCTALESIRIPDSVTAIPFQAFLGCTGLRTVTLPNTLRKIESHAFSGCTALESITLPDGPIEIQRGAFEGCARVGESEGGVTYLGDTAIYYDGSVSSVTLREGTRTVVSGVFEGHLTLRSIDLPASLESLPYGAFSTSGLTNVTFSPASRLKRIESFAFEGTGIRSITVPASVESIGGNAFDLCMSLETVTFAAGSVLQTIESGAFTDADSLESITLPASLKTIGDRAFAGCNLLKSLTIPAGVTSIGADFYSEDLEELHVLSDADCTLRLSDLSQLKKLSIGLGSRIRFNGYTGSQDAINALPNGAIALEEIHVRDIRAWLNQSFNVSYSEVGYPIAADCLLAGATLYLNGEELRNAVIPDGVTKIGNLAFAFCDTLESITIPASVRFIGSYAFGSPTNASTSLQTVEYLGTIEEWERINLLTEDSELLSSLNVRFSQYSTVTGLEDFYVEEQPDGTYVIAGIRDKTKTELMVPTNVSGVKGYIFEGCAAFKSATVPSWLLPSLPKFELETLVINGGTEIADDAFAGCSWLRSVTITSSDVKSIGDGAFAECEALETVVLPEGLETIGECAFISCRAISSISLPTTLKKIGIQAFEGCDQIRESEDGVIYVDDWMVGCIQRKNIHGVTMDRVDCILREGTVGISDGAFEFSYNEYIVYITESVKYLGEDNFHGTFGEIRYAGTEGEWETLISGLSAYGLGELNRSFTVSYEVTFPTSYNDLTAFPHANSDGLG